MRVWDEGGAMRRLLLVLLALVLAVGEASAFGMDNPSSILLLYSVPGVTIRFRLVEARDIPKGFKTSVSKIGFGDISALNHGEAVLSEDTYNFVYSYRLSETDPAMELFSLKVACDGLLLNGKGAPLIGVSFVKADRPEDSAVFPTIDMREVGPVASDKVYGDEFRVRLENKAGRALKAGVYTGTIIVQMTSP